MLELVASLELDAEDHFPFGWAWLEDHRDSTSLGKIIFILHCRVNIFHNNYLI